MVSPKNKKLVWIVLGALVFMNVFAWIVVFDLNKRKSLEVIFFNVGQGDAIFIKTPQGKQVLIDGGPSSVILEKLAKEMPFYDRTIDLVILSHPEKDHLAGLLDVLKRYKIKNILWTGVVRDTAEWKEWLDLIKKENAAIEIAQSGQRIILQGPQPCNSENGCVFIDVLSPLENLGGKEYKDSNETSIVAKLVFLFDWFLFTGDIGDKTEEKLISQGVELSADVLKVAHHGSKYSTSEPFLEKVSPQAAIIQVGENNYGHPTPEVLARLNKFGIKVFDTLKDGDIKIIADGNNFKLKTQNSKRNLRPDLRPRETTTQN